jgi:hypothetical protein
MVKRLSIYLGVQFAYLVFVIVIGALAMAAPMEDRDRRPMKQIVTPEGQTRSPDDPPSKAEDFMLMWRAFKGDDPVPDKLRKKYGLPSEQSPVR